MTPSTCRLQKDGTLEVHQSHSFLDTVHQLRIWWESGEGARKELTIFSTVGERSPPHAAGCQITAKTAAVTDPVKPLASGIGQSLTVAGQTLETEELGPKIAFGLMFCGFRTTRRIAPGSEGNQEELKVVYEMWQSPDWHLLLSTMSDDPRQGRTTMEITDFAPGEPPASSFNLPASYVLRDMGMAGVMPIGVANTTSAVNGQSVSAALSTSMTPK